MKTTRDQLFKMPKIELHAHIGGSIRESTIIELINKKNKDPEAIKQILDSCRIDPKQSKEVGRRNLNECFKMFEVIHDLTSTDVTVMTRITKETIEDYADDNVIYLELRTTPRAIGQNGSKYDYVTHVIKGIEDYYQSHPDSPIIVRLLLTIDRQKSLQEAKENIELAHTYPSKYIVGMDFSGNPFKGPFSNFQHLIKEAREKHKLPFSIHMGEVLNDDEVLLIISTKPERVGHAVCWQSESTRDEFIRSQIPLEVCLSSNHCTTTSREEGDHPFAEYAKTTNRSGMHMCLNCDDKGIFQTTTTDEYLMAADDFSLSVEEFCEMQADMANYIFDKESIEGVRSQIIKYRDSLSSHVC
ncbi:hypothetical protein AKO1_007819 [Acrasis kona]|uniref:Adenosine deaminase domain-containing protein n=1 Tax=Acrasis kona TaxID=1008807 RepID=A0AAW2YQ15_9EUKA